MNKRDLVIIGAGPAGMAAAAEAAGLGLSVTVLDEQSRAGGQIYRDVDLASQSRGDILGADYTEGKHLTEDLRQSGVEHISGAVVWAIEDKFRISYTRKGRAAQIKADRILLATGALERPMPIPGWTLPGVMTAGAGQILLKQSGVVAQGAVLVGAGPLLYLIAAQMVRAGMPPAALVETQTRGNMIRALRHISGAVRGWPYMVKGLKMLRELKRAKVPRYTGATDIAIEGEGKTDAVTFVHKGHKQRIACETVFLHHGVVPNTQAARSLGISHNWDTAQGAFAPALDAWGQSDVAGVFIAGDGAGIGGAKVAVYAGRLAALKIAKDAKRLSPEGCNRMAAPLRRALAQESAARPFLDAAYPPYASALDPADSTVICRCEEVTAGDIRKYAKLGCLGPNQTKAFGRAGMGPCQGRYCGLTVTALLTDANGLSPDETGYYRIRPPLKPVTLGELAAMGDAVQDVTE
ncbi:NAD(P)/FAD-dependent oxidoreductase [Aliiroseovarius crassostreae]|uniref:FAD/NAD(P)-dependent oxidoreductase n=1 Tax=Aliiroseovarius crassostreae TaxID=154981 RepID=UPI002207F390|nr:FAD/NAD(P)-binding oxidoreductase [Aliiroseovarius crassostreae]UWQ08084.1 NAD(P)/FAD-dependent oxidoreductase [Aliiroseovarius crassostreae]UWQ11185.1 NAD(P)/FAD-dependent oxidoreductase [Aliiroseovarius crassostreae]